MNAAAAEVLTVEPTSEAPKAPAPLMTFEAWANLEEDAPGEFVDGQLVEEEVPSHLHESVVSWLTWTMYGWASPRGYPVFGSEHKLRVAHSVAHSVGRKPDLCMYAKGTRLRNAAFSAEPPLLIVEVMSRSPRDIKRDRIEKRQEYAKFGVKHYWLVDPDARIFEFYILGPNGRWIEAADSASEGQVEIPGFDGLILNLDELWQQVDAIIEADEPEIVPTVETEVANVEAKVEEGES